MLRWLGAQRTTLVDGVHVRLSSGHLLVIRGGPLKSWTRNINGSSAGLPSTSNNMLPNSGRGEDDPEQQSRRSRAGPTLFKMFESAATTLASVLILGYVIVVRVER